LIRAVLFDYDGVLTTDKTGSLTTHRHLSRASGLAFSTVAAVFGRYNRDLTLGRTTYARIWPQACQALGRELDIGLLREAFESTPPNEGMFSLARALKARHRVGIVTDNKLDRIDHLRVHQSLDALFDPIVVSASVGSGKEGSAIFQHALDRLALPAHECVFIDNSDANLATAEALGFKTCFHDDGRNDIAALVRALEAHGVATGAA
jgi:putative hydrolase of the HAD superfamily